MPKPKSPFDKLKTEVKELKKEVETVKTSHVIHSDGTYSNPRNEVKPSWEGRLKHRDLLYLVYRGQERREIVMDYDKMGVWTKPASMKQNPSLGHCTHWRWDKKLLAPC